MTLDLLLAMADVTKAASDAADELERRGDTQYRSVLYQKLEQLEGILQRTPADYTIYHRSVIAGGTVQPQVKSPLVCEFCSEPQSDEEALRRHYDWHNEQGSQTRRIVTSSSAKNKLAQGSQPEEHNYTVDPDNV